MTVRSGDPTSSIYHTLARLLESTRRLRAIGDEAGRSQSGERDTFLHLLHVLVEADTLLQYVDPDTDPAEVFGLPRSATAAGAKPSLVFTHADRPGWDFEAWFADKASGVKRAAKALCALCIEEQDGRRREEEPFQEAFAYHLKVVESYARTIFDQISDDKLQIGETALPES